MADESEAGKPAMEIKFSLPDMERIAAGFHAAGRAADAIGKAADAVSAIDIGKGSRSVSWWRAGAWSDLLGMIFRNR